MLFDLNERMYPVYRLCLLGYNKEEIEEKILFSKTNLISKSPFTFDEVTEAYKYFFTTLYTEEIGKNYPACKKAKEEFFKNKENNNV